MRYILSTDLCYQYLHSVKLEFAVASFDLNVIPFILIIKHNILRITNITITTNPGTEIAIIKVRVVSYTALLLLDVVLFSKSLLVEYL